MSLSAFLFVVVTLVGWFASTRYLTSYNVETPFGIFQFQSESSMFQAGAKFMNHENRWSFWKNSDAAWGDHMRFVAEMPEFRAKDGLFAVFAPYWQLFFLLLLSGIGLFFLENLKVTIATTREELSEK